MMMQISKIFRSTEIHDGTYVKNSAFHKSSTWRLMRQTLTSATDTVQLCLAAFYMQMSLNQHNFHN